MSTESYDDLPSAETLRKRRADRRAQRRTRVDRKRRFARRIGVADQALDAFAVRHADTTLCSCALCRPNRLGRERSAGEVRRRMSAESSNEERNADLDL